MNASLTYCWCTRFYDVVLYHCKSALLDLQQGTIVSLQPHLRASSQERKIIFQRNTILRTNTGREIVRNALTVREGGYVIRKGLRRLTVMYSMEHQTIERSGILHMEVCIAPTPPTITSPRFLAPDHTWCCKQQGIWQRIRSVQLRHL